MSDIGHREDTSTRVKGTRQRKGNAAASRSRLVSICIFGKRCGFSLCLLENDTRDLEVLSPCCVGADRLVSAKARFTDGRIHHPLVGYESFISATLLDFATEITIVVPSVNGGRSYRAKKKKSLSHRPYSSHKCDKFTEN